MRVDALVSESHLADHLLPVWDALPADRRGDLHGPKRVAVHAGRPMAPNHPKGIGPPVLVAGYADVLRARSRRTILLEHGAGQTYGDANECYSGGRGRESVALFLCPNETVAARNAAAYPAAHVAVVGCPKLDPWHRDQRSKVHGASIVALAWHWQCDVAPESRTAWPHYRAAMPTLIRWAGENGVTLLGHAHPRAWFAMRKEYDRLGIEPVERFADVLDRADLLVVDNSSVGPEFASIGWPVVWLSAPWYRRAVHHGGRFWDWPAGQVHVEQPDDLITGVERALADPPAVRRCRRAMVREVYTYADGRAAERAAAAIVACLDELARPA